MRRISGCRAATMFCVCLLATIAVSLSAQSGAQGGEWRTYGGDLGNTRYSALDQINSSNFNKLQVVWRLKTDNFGSEPEYKFESTPLMINGVLYTTAGSRRVVVALDAETGEMLWMHREVKALGAPQLRGSFLATALPIGLTARKSEFYMSHPDTA